MGRADIVTKQYMEDNDVFADAFNYLLYGGQQVIQPEQLHILDVTEIEVPYGADKAAVPVQKARDELKYLTAMHDEKNAYIILGIENQTNVHYAMPVKNMVYDALQYAGQVRKAADSHKKAGDRTGHNTGEYLSGFYKDDRLIPVITLVLFFSSEPWEGPMCLYDMLNSTDEAVLSMIDNYRIHLIAPNQLSDDDLRKFRTNLREVLEFIKYSKEKEKLNQIIRNNSRYDRMDRKAAMVMEICTGSDLKIAEKGEVVNMCQAILEMRMEERAAGREEGRIESCVQMIKNLMDSLQCTEDHAMEMLKIPEGKRPLYFEKMHEI